LIKVLLASANYPDKYHLWGIWNKMANIAISRCKGIESEIVAPRPYVLPFKFFPYNEIYKIPIKEKSEEGLVHHPRFPYLLPKNIFYPLEGGLYEYFVTKYIAKNLGKKDLIHSHHVYPDGYGLIKICKKWDVPLVVDIHGEKLFTDFLNKRNLGDKFKQVLGFSSKIICISQNIRLLARKIKIPEEKLEYISLGVDINEFKLRDKEKIKQELGLGEEKIILFVGQLIERKGVKYLLEAIPRIDNLYKKNCKFVIVGNGPEMKELLNISRKLNIQDITLFVGKVSHEELLKWYSLADIFVLPSLSEGRPIVIYEAMASECAIVATNVSGIPEQIKDGYNGLLVEPRDVNMLAEKISYLLDNENEIIRMGKNSRKRIIEEEWTWEGYAKKVIKVYKEVLSQ